MSFYYLICYFQLIFKKKIVCLTRQLLKRRFYPDVPATFRLFVVRIFEELLSVVAAATMLPTPVPKSVENSHKVVYIIHSCIANSIQLL